MSKKVKHEHVKMENTPQGAYRMFCEHCGEDYIPALPLSFDMFDSIIKTFLAEHRHCKPEETAVPDPETAA